MTSRSTSISEVTVWAMVILSLPSPDGLAYRLTDRIVARTGYRHLEIDYDHDGFVYDVKLSGPILGVSIRF